MDEPVADGEVETSQVAGDALPLRSGGPRNAIHSSLTMILPDSVEEEEVKSVQDFSPQVAALSPQVAVPTDAGGDATPVAEGGLSTPIDADEVPVAKGGITPPADDDVKSPVADYQGSEGDALEPVKVEIEKSEVKTEVDVGVSVSYSSTDVVYPPWCASESEIAKPKSKPKSKLPDFFEGEC